MERKTTTNAEVNAMPAQQELPSHLTEARTWTYLPRPRLGDRIAAALDKSRVVALIAGPGWGKTTALRMFAQEHDVPAQWLDMRAEPGNFERARISGSPWKETGPGHDQDPAGGRRWKRSLVIDGLEAVTELDTAVRELRRLIASPGEAPGLILAGRDCAIVAEIAAQLNAVVLDESDLRLSALEASQLARHMGDEYWHGGQEILRLTGGWVAGAAELALDHHNAGAGPASPVTYFAEHVFAHLPMSEQVTLASFSIIDRISLKEAIALAGGDAEQHWHSLRARRMPLTSVTETELILRPPLQAFLQQWLGEHHRHRLEELRIRYLEYLSSVRRFGDAVSWCMRLEDSRRAVELMESAVGPGNVEPPSWEIFRSWFAAVGERALLSNDRIASSLIRRLHRDDRGEEASSIARFLRDEGRSEAIVQAADPESRSILMLSLMRPTDDLMQFSKATRGVAGIEAAGFMLAVMGGDLEVAPPRPTAWDDMAVVVRWGLLWQGRLAEVLGESPDFNFPEAEGQPGDISLAIAAAWAGETARARELWASMDATAANRPLESVAGAALHLVEGDLLRARQIMDQACEVARISTAAFEFAVLGAAIRLLEGDPGTVVQDLPARLAEMRSYRRLAIAEWGDLVLALCYIRLGNEAAALEVINSCTASMERAGRRLFLSSALMVRLHLANLMDDAETAVRIRDQIKALPVERRAVFWERLVAKICQDPAVTRCVDSFDQPIAVTVRPGSSVAVARINPFTWPPRLDLDGQRLVLKRGKYAELVALLALAGGSLDRTALLYKLFPEADLRHASNYLRQVIFKFRETTGITLSRPSLGVVAWPSGGILQSADLEFETAARRFLAQQPENLAEESWDNFKAVLEEASATYLDKSELEWVVERRQELTVLFEEAVLVVIRSALKAGDIDTVRHFGQHAIRVNPYSEDAYAMLMHAELRAGSKAWGLALYRDAFTNLRELDLEPSATLRTLAQRLGER